MEGWIKLFRKIEDWEWYQDSNTFRLFIHCLIKANHNGNKWRGQLIQKGCFITSLENLSLELNLSIQQVRTSIKKLKSTNELTYKSTNKYTLIEIVNYNEYQSNEINNNIQNNILNNKQITNHQQTNNKQITTNKNDKNERIKEKNIYGEFKNVLLAEEEYQKLITYFKSETILKEKIENLSEGIKIHDYKYKDHYATILNWDRRDKKNNPISTKKLDDEGYEI